jgi:hypothetical protein
VPIQRPAAKCWQANDLISGSLQQYLRSALGIFILHAGCAAREQRHGPGRFAGMAEAG